MTTPAHAAPVSASRRTDWHGAWRAARLAIGCAAAAALGGAPALAAAGDGPPGAAANSALKLPPVADFFRTPQMKDPELSPDGKFVAVAITGAAGRLQLAVFDADRPASAKVVAAFEGADVYDYEWVNSQRLVVRVSDTQDMGRSLAPGLYAVNRDGTQERQLIRSSNDFLATQNSTIASRALPWQWSLLRTLRDGSPDVIVEAPVWNASREFASLNLARLDTLTGISTNLGGGAPPNVQAWQVDGKGHPVAVYTTSGDRAISYLNTDQGWSKWQETALFGFPPLHLYVAGSNNQMFVSAGTPSGTSALYQFDPVTRTKAKEPTIKVDGFDFYGKLIFDAGHDRVLGFRFESDAPATAWIDSDLRKIQADVDQMLPGTVNILDCGDCNRPSTVAVSAVSDRRPPVYYLYRPGTHELGAVGSQRPWIVPKQMGQRDMYRFKARDGRMVPVMVTRPDPASHAPHPAVVLVHGGPWVRGTEWTWNGEAQFLASRGYVVIEPEFRGSIGYGFDFFRAGWKQWGLAMQDDVTDATHWAVDQGWVDAARICLGGASYGGYATLMGLIKEPELYKCGFEWVGVTDINLMYSIHWSDESDVAKRYGLPALVGDPVADAKQLESTSPLQLASRLHQPLLMAAGALDRRVPIQHGEAFRDAVRRTNPNVEWVAYAAEGHGWRELDTNVDFWTRVESLLARNIGPLAAPPGAAH